jgi:NAD(P)-dependent dehydrogenase (short-subunit alcohol dehydrogenase family)
MRSVALTGAASGLGAALRQRLEADGCRVVGVDLSGSDIDADLATAEGRQHAAHLIVEATGGTLNGAALCAGIGPPSDPVRMVSVNYFGAIELLDALTPALTTGSPSHVVAISSNSITLVPEAGALVSACLEGDEPAARAHAERLDSSVVYANSKLAVARAVRRRAGDLGAAGVRCNAVAPGPFASALLQATLDDPVLGGLVDALPSPLGSRATPDEVAAAVMFLLSDAAANVHGSLLFVDGGIDATVSPDRVP